MGNAGNGFESGLGRLWYKPNLKVNCLKPYVNAGLLRLWQRCICLVGLGTALSVRCGRPNGEVWCLSEPSTCPI
jgi:hypothetical protein